MFSTTKTVPEAVIALMVLFFLLRSLLSKLYLTILQLSRREMILGRNAMDGLLGWKGWLTGYGWAVSVL
jgi:hypothetical protein